MIGSLALPLIFLLGVSGAPDCKLLAMRDEAYRVIDFWHSEGGTEICIARPEKTGYTLGISIIQNDGSSALDSISISEMLRYYLDVRLSEIETEADKEDWEALRALLVGSLIDFKQGRVGLVIFEKQATGWKRWLNPDPSIRTLEGQSRQELYFYRTSEDSQGSLLLSDKSRF